MRLARTVAAIAATAFLCTTSPPVWASSSATLCVGGVGCLPTIQAAVDAAATGATIRIGPGTFAGGVTISKNLRLVGAGAGRTGRPLPSPTVIPLVITSVSGHRWGPPGLPICDTQNLGGDRYIPVPTT